MNKVAPVRQRADSIGHARTTSFAVSVMIASCVALGLASVLKPLPLFVWNASASVPIGLYAVSGTRPKVQDLVLVRLPDGARTLASDRRYLPSDIPAIKHVVAVGGDLVCTINGAIYINGRHCAEALHRDSQGRVLRPWRGCLRLAVDQIFLLNDALASFDGRYFGPSPRTDVVGILTPLWTMSD